MNSPSPEQHKAALDAAIKANSEAFRRWLKDGADRAPFGTAGIEAAAIAYLSTLPEQTGERWRPIDQGDPKREPEILAYSETGCAGVMLIRWIAMCDFLTDAEIAEYVAQGADEAMLDEPDWFYSDFVQGSRLSQACYPTHWRPVPAPPAGEAS